MAKNQFITTRHYNYIPELEYDLDSQIEFHKFVNDDYREMSNMKVGHYLGIQNDPFAENQEKTDFEKAKELFKKWVE